MATLRLASSARALFAAGLASALFAGAAIAQDEGDKVVLVLNNGKKFTGTFVSRDDANVKIKMGGSEISLPTSFVASVEKVDVGEPAPAPSSASREPASREPEAPATGRSARPAAPASSPDGGAAGSGGEGGAPKGGMFILKDGTVIEGFVVAKAGGRIWIIPGKAVEIDEADVAESYGETEPASGGGKGYVALSGDDASDAGRVLQEFASGDRNRIAAARAILERMGNAAIPALIAALKDGNVEVRDAALNRLYDLRPDSAVEAVIGVVRTDPDVRIRNSAIGKLGPWDPPGGRRAILEAVWRDRDDIVKTSGLLGLTRTAGPEEASALIDLLSILPGDAPGRKHLFSALRKATGERFADDSQIWTAWWDDGGRERLSRQAEVIAERRRKKEEASRFGTPFVDEATPNQAPPSDGSAGQTPMGPPPGPGGAQSGPLPGGPPPEGPK
jgi:hypothetical protein